jgi:hypothetical protein
MWDIFEKRNIKRSRTACVCWIQAMINTESLRRVPVCNWLLSNCEQYREVDVSTRSTVGGKRWMWQGKDEAVVGVVLLRKKWSWEVRLSRNVIKHHAIRMYGGINSLELISVSNPGHCNPLTPELNPSAQRRLTRFFAGDFASWTVHFVNVWLENQQMQQLFIQFINL